MFSPYAASRPITSSSTEALHSAATAASTAIRFSGDTWRRFRSTLDTVTMCTPARLATAVRDTPEAASSMSEYLRLIRIGAAVIVFCSMMKEI